MSELSGSVLVFTHTLHGSLNPILSIAGELSGRNVADVFFAFFDDPCEEVTARLGSVRMTSFGGPAAMEEKDLDGDVYSAITRHPRKVGSIVTAARVMFGKIAGDKYVPLYRRALAEIDRIRPAILVVDAAMTYAMDAAMTRRVPFILSVPFPVSALYAGRLPWDYPASLSGLPHTMTVVQKIANVVFKLRLRVALLTQSYVYSTAIRAKLAGIENWSLSRTRYADAAVAVFGYSVFGFEYPFSPAPVNLRMLGAMVPEVSSGGGANSAVVRWLAEHESVVYIGLGTLMRLSRAQIAAVVAAVGRLGPTHQVLWKLSRAQQELLPPRSLLPANLRIEEWVPSQLEVLAHPHVKVFFCHGGANGVHEGLYYGKPLLVMPFWLDCHDLAVRVVDSGAGLKLDQWQDVDTAEVVAKLSRLLVDGDFRERARYWGQQLKQAGGVRAAVDIILDQCAKASSPALNQH